MNLNFLDFEHSEDEHGHGTFDAMAAVSPAQWPALLAEVRQVLEWARSEFPGQRGPLDDGGQWDCELQGVRELPTPLDLHYDETTGTLEVSEYAAGQPRLTLSVTLTGTPAFCAALQEAFSLG